MAKPKSVPFIEVSQHDRTFVLAKIPAGRLAKIAYAAVRGQDDEPGAVQRVLNADRIASIRQFTLAGGVYPTALVLNWSSHDNPLQRKAGALVFKDMPRSAQLIDGQHRLEGLRAAIAERGDLAGFEVPVAIYENLSTKDCADIFLSINTEQKPVPRSLVFDLYGIASEPIVDPAAVRARDICSFLNEDQRSPYFENIKFPGSPRRRGGIALSTAVSALKPLVEEKGNLDQIGATELETQRTMILNFFLALQDKYGEQWDDSTNAFQYAAGFAGAVDFFKLKLIPYCNNLGSFTTKTISDALRLERSRLIQQALVKGLGGKDAPREIYERLVDAFKPANIKPAKFDM